MPAPSLVGVAVADANTIVYSFHLASSVLPGTEPYYKYYLHIIDTIRNENHTKQFDHNSTLPIQGGFKTDLSYSTEYEVYVETCLVWSYDRLASTYRYERHSDEPEDCTRSDTMRVNTAGMYPIIDFYFETNRAKPSTVMSKMQQTT